MRAPKKYWIKERDNPQHGKYFVLCGQMSKTAAAKAENTKYGCNTMHAYGTEAEYLAQQKYLREKGESVQ